MYLWTHSTISLCKLQWGLNVNLREKIKVEDNLDVTFLWHECRLEKIILQDKECANILTTTTKSSFGLGSLHFLKLLLSIFLLQSKTVRCGRTMKWARFWRHSRESKVNKNRRRTFFQQSVRYGMGKRFSYHGELACWWWSLYVPCKSLFFFTSRGPLPKEGHAHSLI